jgi:hypothetical protein
MASNFYHKIAPHYGDLDNDTGECAGFILGVQENDGGIGVYMYPANSKGDGPDKYSIFLNVEEARDFTYALEKATERAVCQNQYAREQGRGRPHPSRVREP